MKLTKNQLDKLASRLHGTTNNVYRVAESLLGVEVEDEVFDQLRTEAGLFRCVNCDEWLNTTHESPGVPDYCRDCEGDE